MTHWALSANVDRTLGAFGLFLMLILARLAVRAYSPQRTMAGRLSGFLVHRAVNGVAIIGWLVDRLSLSAAPRVAPRAVSRAAGARGAICL
jgi:hypothetical protein